MIGRALASRVCAAACWALPLLACDRDVIVGYTDAAQSTPPEITWLTGAHPGNDLQDYADFGAWRGRPLEVAHVFTDRTGGWPDIVTPSWPIDMLEPFDGSIVISQPLFPEAIGGNLTDCAAGAYDVEWQKLGTFLIERGRADAIVRLGWGFNDNEHEWAAGADVDGWIACFQRVVTAIRSTNPQIQIDWTFNPPGPAEVSAGDPYAGYPGDDYVDFIGLEAFDEYPATFDDAAWQQKCTREAGLCSAFEFARTHGKRVGIAEWGVVSCGEESGGDNLFYIRKMVETFAANADVLAYEAYFEDGGLDVCSNLESGEHPNAAAEYQRLYRSR